MIFSQGSFFPSPLRKKSHSLEQMRKHEMLDRSVFRWICLLTFLPAWRSPNGFSCDCLYWKRCSSCRHAVKYHMVFFLVWYLMWLCLEINATLSNYSFDFFSLTTPFFTTCQTYVKNNLHLLFVSCSTFFFFFLVWAIVICSSVIPRYFRNALSSLSLFFLLLSPVFPLLTFLPFFSLTVFACAIF